MNKYAWSLNEEYYDSMLGNKIEVAIKNLIKDNELKKEFEKNEFAIVYIGETNFYEDKGSDIYDEMIEHFQNIAYDKVGEFSEGYLDNITHESEQILKKGLDKLWNSFLESGHLEPSFFKCENIKEYIVYANGDYEEITGDEENGTINT